MVSHDLDLLDDAITRVLHLDRDGDDDAGTLIEYKGTYSQYLVGATQGRGAARQAGRRASRPRSIGCSGSSTGSVPRPRKAAMAHSLEKRIDRIQRDAVAGAQGGRRSLRVKFPPPPQPGRTVLEVDGLAKSYGALDVFDDVTFDVGRGERLLVMGLNGAGKTSLLRILAG